MVELKVVATASDDQTHEGDAQSVHVHGNVFTCGEDGKVKFTLSKQLVTKPGDDIESVLIHAGRVLTCSTSGSIKIWDHNNLKLLNEFKAHDYSINDLLVLGNTLFTCSVDATIKTWDLETLQLKKTLAPHVDSVRKLATNGTNVFAGDDNGEVRVYDQEGEFLAMYGVVEEVWDLHAQDDLLYTVRDRGVTITQTKGETNKFTVTKSLDGRAPLCVVGNHLSFPDTSGLSICVHDNTFGSYKLRGQLQGHEMIITALAGWGPDRLVSSGWDNQVRLWDLSALKGLASCALPGCPNGLACSQDGCVFAAGAEGFLCKMKAV
ncbi:myosin heavy chain kinase B isoform X2 [Procambarus clarkii]|uniref:myosin heavy chain kinase B isoform X2 n=1 Tax=Procambarus clarkii TaxID=6728 RepID=UPI001E675DE7|nr:pre-mRNA-splicing factor PRP46-like isoform X2 [Procambarus clarkii]